MNTIIIDPVKCKKDGFCIAECPYLLFHEGKDGIPVLVDGGQEACIACGHCIAICPGNAIALNGVTTNDCEKIDPKQSVTQEQVEQLFRGRRSIRTYRKKIIDHKALESLLDLSRWAPSARNTQPVSWIVINDFEKVQQLSTLVVDWLSQNNALPNVVDAFKSGHDMIHRKAPCLIIAHASNSSPRPVEDCSIAVAAIETAATTYGLGGCWAGFFMGAAKAHQPILEYLDLPEGHEVYAALILGYPKYKFNHIPPREKAKIDWRV